jgi:type IV secretion system protein VirB8
MEELQHDWLRAHYVDATDWHQQTFGDAVIWRNRALVFAAGCLLIAGGAIGVAYASFNRPPPETPIITYNELTGVVRTQYGTDVKRHLTDDERVIKGYINRFITACETWDYADQATRARAVTLLSTREVNNECSKLVAESDPASLAATLGPKGKRRVEVTGVSFLSRDTVSVLFTAYDSRQGSIEDKEVPRGFVGIVKFKFTEAPKDERDVFVNELGFQAIHYRRDQELRQLNTDQ